MFEDFVQSAIRRKTKLSITFSDLPTLVDELRDAQQAAYPNPDRGKIGGQLEKESLGGRLPRKSHLDVPAILITYLSNYPYSYLSTITER